MKTRAIKTQPQWQKLTTSGEDTTVQITHPVCICRADTEPAADQPFMTFEHTTLTISAGDTAWIKSRGADSVVTVW